jgi:hypothetical protein
MIDIPLTKHFDVDRDAPVATGCAVGRIGAITVTRIGTAQPPE